MVERDEAPSGDRYARGLECRFPVGRLTDMSTSKIAHNLPDIKAASEPRARACGLCLMERALNANN